ncbi:lysophospholipid acyltransferase 5 isoform X2 [Alligator sinensis]|uniref:Lysophospholipid acyltransferase 5 n=1 Tax=Alligator sinensis TaxID=38654 RepID=A0A3Q0FNP7_ALLSI|nr:lysophospholipid acyltransferase 5 isoform X2 [Alligator sinensis]
MAVRGSGLGLAAVAEALGSSEQALRLIVSILMGYPFALFQRYFLFQKEVYLIHLYNTLTGLSIAYFNFGAQFFHSLLCVLIQFLILRLMGRTITAVCTTFCFQMTYLMAGYYFTATEHYDIKWTMPHCVLTLKLIGLAIDYYDGGQVVGIASTDPILGIALPSASTQSLVIKREQSTIIFPKEVLTPEQQRFAVRGVPTLLEVSGFSYFYGAFMVGPQFSMTDYQKLARGEMTDVPGQRPNSFVPALKRLTLGLICLVIYTLLSPYVSDEYFLSDKFLEQSFWFRCFYMLVWGKVVLYKYVTCWLVTEGVCILIGLGYNGQDENGKPKWDACANMKVWLYETTPLFTGTIASFNINTNAWVARYIFKRLKFLGNKLLSQALALFFLAIWHGLHSGYLVCFQMELLIVIVEKQVVSLVRNSPALSTLASITVLKPVFYVLQQTNHWMFMGYSLVSFCLFTWDKWLKVYSSVYFIGHVLFLTLLFGLPYIHRMLVPRKEKLKKAE